MKKLILAAMLFATPALAQQSYTLTISEPMLNTIGKGLGELPFKDAAPVMQYLQQQVMISQQKAAKPEEKKTEEKKD